MKPFDKTIYYILNFTWGIIMNIFGAIGACIMFAQGKKPIRHGGSIMFATGSGWGGVSLGIFSFVCEEASKHTKDHEYGHSLQNAVYGPLFPFIVAIPSFVRYHLITKKVITVKNYDDIWFDGQATDWGTKTIDKW